MNMLSVASVSTLSGKKKRSDSTLPTAVPRQPCKGNRSVFSDRSMRLMIAAG